MGNINRGKKAFSKAMLGQLKRTFCFASLTVSLFILLGVTFQLVFSSESASAAQTVPYKVNFQGRLTNTSGNAVADGLYNIQFKLYDTSTAGTLLWSETRETTNRVQVTNGLFSVQLGDVSALSPTLFSTSAARYFEVTMATPATANCTTAACAVWESPMSPRRPLGTSTYAMNSDLLDGQDGDYYTNAANLTGTVSSSRLSGSYTGITGTGTLTTGFIGAGFGTIATGNTISGTRLISTVATGTAPLTVTSTTIVTNLNADLLDGQQGSYYTSAANLTGTVASARIAGSYTGITGTGALNAGSITSGFGVINTGDTITGTTINGTTGINTGVGAGTQRIDASGNLVNIGNVTASGSVLINGHGIGSYDNAIDNPGFETGNEDHGWVNNASFTLESTDTRTGNHALTATSNAVNTYYEHVADIPVQAGENWYGEVWVKSVAAAGQGGLRFAWYQKSGAVSAVSANTYPGFTSTTADTWTKASGLATAPSDAAFLRIFIRLGSATTGVVHKFDDVYAKREVDLPSLNILGTTVLTSSRVLQNVSMDASLLTGAVASARITGSYTGITGTGALNAGSISTGFGAINTGDTISGSQLISTVANGTAPLTVNSTTKVANLNSDTLDGLDSSAFATTGSLANYIQLQAATPGAAQTGHINISGTVIAGTFSGSGASLTSLNGTNIATGTIANARLTGSGALTVTAGNGLSGGGSVALGGTTTLTVGAGTCITVGATTVGVTGSCLTSTGILSTGSIASGFGTIVTGNTISGTQLISTVATGTAPLVVTSTTQVANLNASFLSGQNGAYYQNATNLNAGTINTARVAGSYTGITGTGALNAGSITSGFGTINTGDTITGTTLNGTTGINTGAGAGTQRIDASGNLVNIGNVTASGSAVFSGRTIQQSNLYPEYKWRFGGAQDLSWKKVADITMNTTLYSGVSMEVELLDVNGNFGNTSNSVPMRFYVSAVRSSAVLDDTNNGTVAGPSTDYVRLVKTATGVYELQVRQTVDWRHIEMTSRVISIGSGAGIVYVDNPVNGSTIGTIYSSSTTGYTQELANADVNGNLQMGGTTVLTSGRVLQNVTADAGILTSGTIANARLTGSGALTVTAGNGLSGGGSVALGGTTTLTVGAGTCITVGATTVGVTGSCLTSTGILSAGSIASGFGTIVTGNTISGSTLASTVATGTAPLTVASTTLVTNLNTDLLDGQHGSYYQNATNLNAGTINTARVAGSYTGITGTGALNAGSITAGFGVINTGDTITGTTINGTTGFQVNGAATSGTYLRGNGTNYVASTIQAADIPTLNQNTTGSAYSLVSRDTRAVADAPQDLPLGVDFDFKQNATNGLSDGGTYNGVMSWRKYGTATDFSGGAALQMAYSDNGNLWTRISTGTTTWGSWTKSWADNNDGTGSGLDADLLDGNSSAFFQDATNLNAGTINTARVSGSYTGITGTGALTVGSIASGFGTIVTGNTISGTQLISTVATGTAPLVVTSTTQVANLNASFLSGQNGAYYQNATNLNAGTINTARVAGSYTGITGTGALNAGSITSGFGTINTGDTITGTTLNGTTGINTGAGAGTQRIDASGNLVNINNATIVGTMKLQNAAIEGITDWKVFRNLASYNNSNAAAAGAFVIETSITAPTSVMTRTTIEGYFYDSSSPFSLDIGSYFNNTFSNKGYVNVGGKKIEVRLARNITTDKVVIILGNEASTYPYPKLTVTSFMEGHSGHTEAHATGWTISQQTSLANYDDGNLGVAGSTVTVPDVTSINASSITGTIANARLVNSGTLAIGPGNGLTGGGSVALGGSTTLHVGAGTCITVGAATVGVTGSCLTSTGILSAGSIASGFGTIVTGNTISGTQLISTVASGTAPLVVTSTTKVTNLNVDQLDGLDSTYFTNGTNIATGTIANARLTGSGALTVTAGNGLSGGGSVALGGTTTLTVGAGTCITVGATTVGVTGSCLQSTGALTAGSIGTGFGTIVTGNTISGSTLASTVATGTAPLTVASTTLVANLNADLLDGLDSTAFATASSLSGYVQLQGTSSGTQQTGNINVSGNLIAGSKVGIGINSAPLTYLQINGTDTFFGQVMLQGTATGASSQTFMTFWDGPGSRTGYIGDYAAGNSDMYVMSDSGAIRLLGTQVLTNTVRNEATPDYSFVGNTGTGMYLHASDYLGFAHTGSTTMCANKSQLYIGGALGNCLGIDSGTSLKVEDSSAPVAEFNRKTDDGVIVQFSQASTVEGNISVSGTTISYNAFTGSHYAKIDSGTIERGELASLTDNVHYRENRAEPVYGIKKSAIANDPNIMGAYLDINDSALPFNIDSNPHLVMAAGNGDVWVADNGTGNLKVGDQMISSGDVAGYAQRDSKTYAVSHVFAKAAESIDWNTVTTTVNGVKVKKVSVLFSFYDSSNVATNLQSGSLDISGDASINGSLSVGDSLNVLGETTLAGLKVTGTAEFTGTIIARDAEFTGTLSINGKILFRGEKPTIVTGVALGQDNVTQAAVEIDGTDNAGTVTLTSAGKANATGVLAHISFSSSFTTSYKAVLSAVNDNATDLRVYLVKTPTGFDIVTKDAPVAGTQYQFDYILVGTSNE